MNPKIHIIILNWNGFPDTLECLESLRKIEYDNYEVVIVDNNSSGDDVKIVKEKFGDFVKQIIVAKDNLGFSGGNNLGIKYSLNNGADFILLLNNDTTVEPDFLNKLLDTSKAFPEADILTPRINYYSDKEIIWFAGGHISKIRAAGIPDGIGKHERNYFRDRYCNFASGCCMYIKKEVIEKIGYFDENYFLYQEDTDFSLRAYEAGLKIFYASSSKIYHKVSATISKSNSFLSLYFSTRNRLYFAKKNLNRYYYYGIIAFLIITFPIKLFFLRERIKAVKTFLTAFNDMFLQNFGKGSFLK